MVQDSPADKGGYSVSMKQVYVSIIFIIVNYTG